ncbi:MAG TPA: hypothetical protein VGM88_31475 [Kofleriaceae bacterium]|jgi:hypothetical protein
MKRIALLLALAACKGHKSAPAAGSGSAAAPVDDSRCLAVLQNGHKLSPWRRITALIDACHPCGDWKPILDWSVPTKDGGPTRAQLDAAMDGCHAFCSSTAKQHFLGTLDDARGTEARTPWRVLGDTCKEQVSALPDSRFETAPLFALDRIARYVGTSPELRAAASGFVVPLPPVGIGGVGISLPTSSVVSPLAGALVTVSATELRVASQPFARLADDGAKVDFDGDEYPGPVVAPDALAANLEQRKALGAVLVAPAQMDAIFIRLAVGAAGTHTLTQLAVAAPAAPRGWQLPGVVPIALQSGDDFAPGSVMFEVGADPDPIVAQVKAHGSQLLAAPLELRIGPGATVQSLATVLGALGYYHVTTVTLIPQLVRH